VSPAIWLTVVLACLLSGVIGWHMCETKYVWKFAKLKKKIDEISDDLHKLKAEGTGSQD